jgi:hypothetical protein
MERIEASDLRSMFLPTTSKVGEHMLHKNDHFVRCQMKHYGVDFKEREFSGDGSALMGREVLEEGRCDQVPSHILELEQSEYRHGERNT